MSAARRIDRSARDGLVSYECQRAQPEKAHRQAPAGWIHSMHSVHFVTNTMLTASSTGGMPGFVASRVAEHSSPPVSMLQEASPAKQGGGMVVPQKG
jgi:hypothetical protein